MRAKLVNVRMRVEMSVVGEGHSSASENIAAAEKVAYLYVAPVILTVGILGSAANLLVLSNKRRFDGRLYVYLRVRGHGLMVHKLVNHGEGGEFENQNSLTILLTSLGHYIHSNSIIN